MSRPRDRRVLDRAVSSALAGLHRRIKAIVSSDPVWLVPRFESLEARTLMARVEGIDVSQFQGTINWSQVRAAGKEFAFQRATIGGSVDASNLDTSLSINMSAGASAGMLMGVYHHAKPDSSASDAANEAAWFLSKAGQYMGSGWLRPVIDIETNGGLDVATMSQWINDFSDAIESAKGVTPVIYSNSSNARDSLNSSVIDHDLFLARYNTGHPGSVNPQTSNPETPAGFANPYGVWNVPVGGAPSHDSWSFWQYSDEGSVGGITGDVDLDVFQGERSDLEAQFLIPTSSAFQGVSVNFGPYEHPAPSGYINFGNQTFGNLFGYQMGWDSAGVVTSTQGTGPDERYKSYAFPRVLGVNHVFEIAVPNGAYRVRLVAGGQVGNTQKLWAEEVSVVDAITNTGAEFRSGVATVNVSDGRLTISSSAAAANTRLVFLDVVPAARVGATPAAPSGVSATPASSTAIDVRWVDNADNEGRDPSTFQSSTWSQVNEGYKIERRTFSGGSWSGWSTIAHARANAELYQDTGLSNGNQYQYRVSAVNAVGSSAAVEGAAVSPASSGGQQPYNATGTAWTVGATIQAEDFDRGGQGDSFSDTSTGSAGGFYRESGMDVGRIGSSGAAGAPLSPRQHRIGWFRPGEWVEYTVDVPTAGTHVMEFRVSVLGTGAKFHATTTPQGGSEKNLAEPNAGDRWDVPDTGNWDVFQTITKSVQLPAGAQVIRVYADVKVTTNPGVMDFDWLRISRLVDLSVDDTTESNEETAGRFVQINDSHDEQNTDLRGDPLADNEADAAAGDRVLASDPDLVDASLTVQAAGTWSLNFPDNILVWRESSPGVFDVLVLDGVEMTAGGAQTINLKIEGIAASGAVNATELTAELTPASGPVIADTVKLTVTSVDLDVDSENDNFYQQPDRDRWEERLEQDASKPGKIVYVNDNDDDGDSVTDNIDYDNEDERFVPVPLIVRRPFDPATAVYRITYEDGSSALRLWRREPDQPRDEDELANGGDFIAAGEYSGTQLGINRSNPAPTLWLEAAAMPAAAHQQIVIEVDPDGAGPSGFVLSDSVWVTVKPSADEGAAISGFKWDDRNGDGIRNTVPVQGDPPNLVYVIDVSGSTAEHFEGQDNVGDVNGDNVDPNTGLPYPDDRMANTILDAELASYIALNNYLIQRTLNGDFDGTPQISIVLFGKNAVTLDMDPITGGTQLSADVSTNINDLLATIQIGHLGAGTSTNYVAALDETVEVIDGLAVPGDEVSVVFLSDGYPNPDNRNVYLPKAEALHNNGVQVMAFGAGAGAKQGPLDDVDSDTGIIFYTRDELIEAFAEGLETYSEPGLGGWEIYAFIDSNSNGQYDAGIDGTRYSAVSDALGNYAILGLPAGTYTVREVNQAGWVQRAPGSGSFQVTLTTGEVEDEAHFGNQFNGSVDLIPPGTTYANDKDVDRDAILDFADGYDRDETAANADDETDGEEFTPLTLNLADFGDLAGATITFGYDGSDPDDVTGSGYTAMPGENYLRLWRVDGSQARVVADYLKPGTRYSATDLGFSATTTQVQFFIEGITPNASQFIRVTIDPDGLGGSNAVFEDAVELEITARPEIISNPTSTHLLPGPMSESRGPVDPQELVLTLDDDTDEVTQRVKVTVPALTPPPPPPMVDVFLLFDDTGSFAENLPLVRQKFPAIIDNLKAAFPAISFAFGVGRFEEYGAFATEDPSGRPFTLNQPIVRSDTVGFSAAIEAALAAGRTAPGGGGDGPETLTEGLFQVATGAGFDGDGDGSKLGSGVAGSVSTQLTPGDSGDVPPFRSFSPDSANQVLPPDGTLGGVGFRRGAIPIILSATDIGTAYEPEPSGINKIIGAGGVEVPLSEFTAYSRGSTPDGRGATIQNTVTALAALGAKVIGLGTNGEADSDPRQVLEAFARATGSVSRVASPIDSGVAGDPIEFGDPLYFGITSGNADSIANGVVSGIKTAVAGLSFGIDVVASDPNVEITNLTSGPQAIVPGAPVEFDVKFTGATGPRSFDLLFVRREESQTGSSGIVYGSIPVQLNVPYVYAITTNPVGAAAQIVSKEGPAGVTEVDAEIVNGKLIFRPEAEGTYDFVIEVVDAQGVLSRPQAFSVTVDTQGEGNSAPTMSEVPDQNLFVNQSMETLDLGATDPDDNPLQYLLYDAPEGMTIDRDTGEIDWTPTQQQIGTHVVQVRVIDGHGGETNQEVNFTVALSPVPNTSPQVVSTDVVTAVAGRHYSYEVVAVDFDLDPVHFEEIDLPSGMELDAETGTLSWDPTSLQVGQHVVEIEARDNRGGVDPHSFTITVLPAAPAAPTGLTAAPASDAAILLDWANNSESNLDGYFVYRSTSASGPFQRINEEPIAVSKFLDTDLIPDTQYFYRVTAVHDQGVQSDPSAQATATTDAEDNAPGMPQNFTATGQSDGVLLEWDANPELDLHGYFLWRRIGTSGDFVPIRFFDAEEQGATSFLDDAVAPDEHAYYLLAAVDFAGNISDDANSDAVRSGALPTISSVDIDDDPSDARNKLLTANASDPDDAPLTYTWMVIDGPNGAPMPTFDVNGTEQADEVTITFGKRGTYTFVLTVRNAAGKSQSEEFEVEVDAVATEIFASPTRVSLSVNDTQTFVAALRDQFGEEMAETNPPRDFDWSLDTDFSGAGLTTAVENGHDVAHYTAGTTSGGDDVVRVEYEVSLGVVLSDEVTISVAASGAQIYAWYTTFPVTEGVAWTDPIGAFLDEESNTSLGDYEVTVNWGDGSPTENNNSTNGTIELTRDLDGKTWIAGEHAYAASREEPYAITIEIEHTPTGRSLTITSLATVMPAAITVTATDFSATVGQALDDVVVATFTDSVPQGNLEDYSAFVNWGDGDVTPATVRAATGGGFEVVADHTYRMPGEIEFSVLVFDPDGAWDTDEGIATVAAANVPGPTEFEAGGMATGRVYLEWDAMPGMAGYVLWRTDADGRRARIPEEQDQLIFGSATGNGRLYYIDLDLPANQTFTYTIQAVDQSGNLSPEMPAYEPATTFPMPAPPTSVAAQAQSGTRVRLTWTQPADPHGIFGWDVLRSETQNGDYSSILPPGHYVVLPEGSTTAVHDDQTAQPDKTYWYKIVAVRKEAPLPGSSEPVVVRSDPSSAVEVHTLVGVAAPLAPTNLTGGYAGFGRVGLRWEYASTSVLGFDVYRSTDEDFVPSAATLIGSSADPFYTDDGLNGAAANTYYYRVVAVVDDMDGHELSSQPSNVATVDTTVDPTAAPDAPEDLEAAEAVDRVTLTWVDNSVDEAEFKIYRRETGLFSWVLIGRTTANDTRFVDMTTLASTNYEYGVAAYNSFGESTPLTTTTATTPDIGVEPASPQNLDDVSVAFNSVDLEWDVVASTVDYTIAGYHVYRDNGDGVFVRLTVAPVTGTTYTDDTVRSATEYDYYVTSVSSQNRQSQPSNTLLVETPTAAATKPSVQITSPSPAQTAWEIKAQQKIFGIIDDINAGDPSGELDSWSLTLEPVNVASGMSAIPVASGEGPVGSLLGEPGLIATLDPSMYPSGAYDLVLTAIDKGGLQADGIRQRVNLFSDIKLGNLNLPIVDWTIDVPGGTPITVRRVYDSQLASEKGDFGYGWKLELTETELRTTERASTREPGDRSLRTGDLIYVTVPGEGQHVFQFVPRPLGYNPSSPNGPYFTYEPQFVCVDGSGAQLTVDKNIAQGISSGAPIVLVPDGTEFVDHSAGELYNPVTAVFGNRYYLQTADGTKHTITATSGKLESSTDPNGNVTDYSGGNASGNGVAVYVHRNASGLVSSISLNPNPAAAGPKILYHYGSDTADPNDHADDLVEVVDRMNVPTAYGYSPAHYLTSIADARGVTVLEAAYDESGRLKSLSDATNQTAPVREGGFDGVSARRVTKDLDGLETESILDSRGSVVREIRQFRDGNGQLKYRVTVRAYSYATAHAFDVVDTGRSLVNTPQSMVEYQPFEIDAPDMAGERYTKAPTSLARSVGFYAAEDNANLGFPASQTVIGADGSERTTKFFHYFMGKPQRVEDPFGNVTLLTYDAAGNLTSTTNVALETTYFTYTDGSGGLPKGLPLQTYRVRPGGSDTNPADRIVDVDNVYYDATPTTPSGVTTDVAGSRFRLATTTNFAGVTTRFTYEANGNIEYVYREWTDGQGLHRVPESFTDYDDAGRIVETIDANNQSAQIEYNSAGQVWKTIDAYGGVTESHYDDRGQLVQTDYPDGTRTHSVYDASGRMILSVDRFVPGQSDPVQAIRTIYDSLGRVVETHRVSGVSVTVTAASGLSDVYRVTAVSGAGLLVDTGVSVAGVWKLDATYDDYLFRAQTIYNADGRVSGTVDIAGLHTETEYYANGQVKRTRPVTMPATGWTTYEYDKRDGLPAGAVKYDSVTDALGHTTKAYADAFGRVVRTMFHDGSFTQSLYGFVADLPLEQRPTTITNLDALTFVKGIEQRPSSQSGDAPTAAQTTIHYYDPSGRLVAVMQPDADADGTFLGNPIWRYTYDANGNQLTQTDPKGHTTSFAYDQLNRRTSRTLPSDGNPATNDSENWTFDSRGRIGTHVDFKGQSTKFVYDETDEHGGQLLEEQRFTGAVDLSPDEKTVFEYDNLGRQESVEEFEAGNMSTAARSTTYGFDPITGRLSEVDSPEGTINYAYDPATGRLIRTFTLHSETAYGYDAQGRLEHVYQVKVNGDSNGVTYNSWDDEDQEPTFSGGTPDVTTYTYDGVGNLDTVELPSGVTSDYGYDTLNRLIGLVVTDGDDDLLFEQAFEHYDDGQRKNALEKWYDGSGTTTPFSAVRVRWEYDALDRLTQEVRDEDDDGQTDPEDYKHTFTFDDAGNRKLKLVDEANDGTVEERTAYAYNDRDQLTSEGADADNDGTPDPATDTTHAYDANGSTTLVSSSAGDKAYFWDLRNRMVGYSANGDADTSDAGDATFTYDHEGTRVSRVVNIDDDANGTVDRQEATYFLQDKNNPTGYSQILEESSTTSLADAPERSYVIGQDVIAQADGSTVRHLLYDGGGSTRGLLDATGQPVTGQVYAYDAFGVRIDGSISILTPLLYRGEYFDAVLGQYQLRARYYDPMSGRFSSFDSYWGSSSDPSSIHKYIYGSANPIMYADPSGQLSLTQLTVGIGLAGALAGFLWPAPTLAVRAQRALSWGLLAFAAAELAVVATAGGIVLLAHAGIYTVGPAGLITASEIALGGSVFAAGSTGLRSILQSPARTPIPVTATPVLPVISAGGAQRGTETAEEIYFAREIASRGYTVRMNGNAPGPDLQVVGGPGIASPMPISIKTVEGARVDHVTRQLQIAKNNNEPYVILDARKSSLSGSEVIQGVMDAARKKYFQVIQTVRIVTKEFDVTLHDEGRQGLN